MSDPNLISPDESILESPFITRRRRWITLVVFMCVAVSVYTGWWFWLKGTAEEQLNAWIADQRREGRIVQTASIKFTGYPGVMKIRAQEFSITDPDAGWRLEVPALKAALSPWKIDQVDGQFDGPIRLEVSKQDRPKAFSFNARTNHWSVDRDQGGRLRIDVDDAKLADENTKDVLSVMHAKAVLIRGSIPVYGALKLTAGNITMPKSAYAPLGHDIKSLDTRLEFVGAIPPGNLNAEALARWAGDSGALEVRSLNIVHGPLGLKGDGTMALDGNLQPIGAFRARVTGYDASLDQLMAAGLVRSSEGKIAKMILGAVAKVPQGGGPKQIDVPISVQDQKLSVGPIQLMRIPTIRWSAAATH